MFSLRFGLITDFLDKMSTPRTAKITDYYQTTKKPTVPSTTPSGRKRKTVFDSVPLTPSSSPILTRSQLKDEEGHTPPKVGRMVIKNRSRMLVQLAQQSSPQKDSPVKKDEEIVSLTTSCVRKNLFDNSSPIIVKKQEDEEETNDSKCIFESPVTSPIKREEVKEDESSPFKIPESPAKIVLSPLKFSLDKPILHRSPLKSPVKKPSSRKLFEGDVLCIQMNKKTPEKDRASGLVLSPNYKSLSVHFSTLDDVLSMQMMAKQQTTFDKIRVGVKTALGSREQSFNQTKLLQILTVWSDAYQLKYERVSSNNVSSGQSKLNYSLIIRPSRREHPDDPSSQLICPINLLPSVRVARKEEFTKRLINIMKEQHEEFLLNMKTPLRIDSNKLIKWHKDFDLKKVRDIVPDMSLLPVAPERRESGNVEEVLERMKNTLNSPRSLPGSPARFIGMSPLAKNLPVTPKIEDLKKEEGSLTSKVISKIGEKIKAGPLKGLSVAFVEKLREKERTQIELDMTRDPELEKKLSHINHMPKMIRLLRNYFLGEKKRVLPMPQVVRKVIDSYETYISSEDVEERLSYMKEVLPDWILIFDIKNVSYIRLLKMNAKLTDLEIRLRETSEKMSQGAVLASP